MPESRMSELLLYVVKNLVQIQSALAVVFLLLLIRWIYKRVTSVSISSLPGPAKSDWLLGNLTDLSFKDAGVPYIEWQKQYGSVFKIYGMFGEESLMISDPKAIQHVYTNCYVFVRQKQHRQFLESITGPGLAVAHGDVHRRQRRVLQPAFGISQLKALIPVFSRHSQNLLSVIKKDIEARGNDQTALLNVHDYMTRVTLDIIGEAAFDYQFLSLDNKEDALTDAFHNMETNSFTNDSKRAVFSHYVTDYLPSWVLKLLGYIPTKRFLGIRKVRDMVATKAERLVQQKVDMYIRGLEGSKDVISLLVRANAKEDQEDKLSDAEMNAQIATLVFAGHVTTANTLTFGLWELARNVEMQNRIRQEILDAKRTFEEQCDTAMGFVTHDTHPLLNAFIKEVLRYHPIGYPGGRVAIEDSVIPLSKPLKLASGNFVQEIPVSKGQKVWVNIPGYNRLPEIFGGDSHEFNIDRWISDNSTDKRTDKGSHGIGVYGGLLTFAHGPRACLGWRFTLYELQVLLIDLISNFEFALPQDARKYVRRVPGPLMLPGLRGEGSPALFLSVSVVQN